MSGSKFYPSTEAAEQEAVIAYCDIKQIPVVHIANEGKRSARYGAALKRLGMRRGFPDLFFPMANSSYHGLFIEMKYGKGRLSAEQKEWIALLSENGYACQVCYSCSEAIRVIENYMKTE